MAGQSRQKRTKLAIQLRISLQGHTPTVQRPLVVPGDIRLSKLHPVLQSAMGWEDCHLYLFRIGESTYGEPEDEDETELDDGDAASVVLSEVAEAPMRFSYHYDFGDDWQHEVAVEAIEPVPLALRFAVCVDGERTCPPENCGGTRGFRDFVAAITDPTHEEHADYVRWVGHPFDPESFSLAATNAALQQVR